MLQNTQTRPDDNVHFGKDILREHGRINEAENHHGVQDGFALHTKRYHDDQRSALAAHFLFFSSFSSLSFVI